MFLCKISFPFSISPFWCSESTSVVSHIVPVKVLALASSSLSIWEFSSTFATEPVGEVAFGVVGTSKTKFIGVGVIEAGLIGI